MSGCMVSWVNPEKKSNTETLLRRRGYRGPHRRGDRDLWYFCDLFQFLIVDGDSNASGFLWDAFERARPWRGGVLDEAGGEVRVENGVYLLREDRVQSVRP